MVTDLYRNVFKIVLQFLVKNGEMDVFYNPSKIFKLKQFILIIVGTSKKH